MAMFDKTFPTLDCAACILTPKMSAAGKEPNIEMLAYSEVTEVDGYVGNFKVKVKKKARYIDTDKCTGCALCTEACVVRKVPNEFDQGLSKRSAAYIPFPQAVPTARDHRPDPLPHADGQEVQAALRDGLRPRGHRLRPEGRGDRGRGRGHHHGHRLPALGPDAGHALQLRQARQRHLEPRVRAHLERLRADRRPHRLQERRAAQVGRHPALRRQPRRELPGVLLARLLHVLAQVLAPHQGAPARDRGVRVLHRHAHLRQGLRGVLQAPHERGRPLHPRPRRRGERRTRCRPRRRAAWSSRSRTRCSASRGACPSTW